MGRLNGLIMFSVGKDKRTLNLNKIVSISFTDDRVTFEIADTQALSEYVRFSPMAMLGGMHTTRNVHIPVKSYAQGQKVFKECLAHLARTIKGTTIPINSETRMILSDLAILQISQVDNTQISGMESVKILPTQGISDVMIEGRENFTILTITGTDTIRIQCSEEFSETVYVLVSELVRTSTMRPDTDCDVLNLGKFEERD